MRRVVVLCCLCLALLLPACSEEKQERLQAIYHLVEARNHYIEGNFRLAEKEYETYLRKAPDGEHSWEAWNRRVLIWQTAHNNSTRAAEILEEMALEYSEAPDRVLDILPRLANAYHSAGELDQAVARWEEYLALEHLDPFNATVTVHRVARLQQERRDYDEALKAVARCLRLSQPGQEGQHSSPAIRDLWHRCRYEQARTKLLMQRLDEARPQLEALIQSPDIDPTLNATAGYVLAEIYRTEQKTREAINMLKTILPTYPNQAVILNRLKKFEEASK